MNMRAALHPLALLLLAPLAACAPSLDALRSSSSTRTVPVARAPAAVADCLIPKLDAIKVGLVGMTFPTHRRDVPGGVNLFANNGMEYFWLVEIRPGQAQAWTSGTILYGGDLIGDIAAMTAACAATG